MGKDLRKRAKQSHAAVASLDRERASQRALMARKRAAGRDLVIPPVCNPRRRRRCEKDPALFLKTYFPIIFFNAFTSNQRSIIKEFIDRLQFGGWKAETAPRKEGKTSLLRCLTIYAIVYGFRRFVVIIGANAREADDNLENIRAEFERNDQLAEDFPEICTPIHALAGASQRASAQTVAGRRTHLKWTGDVIRLPVVAGSSASGAMITSRGIEGTIRGMNFRGQRPDLVLIDDPETDETAHSPVEIEKRERIIESDIVGLGGEKSIAILYTCTIIAANCLADKFTDPKVKPAWDGTRRKLLVQKPDREDMWTRYMELRQDGVLKGDKSGRKAHKYYLANRRAMDAGAVVSNPYRFDPTEMPDGSAKQVSALQFCYDFIADTDWSHFNSEYQNIPPLGHVAELIDINAQTVMKRCSGRDRGTVTPEADYLTAGLDVGGRAVHWTVMAWKRSASLIIDYGVIRVHSPLVGNLEDPENLAAVQDAILAALCEFRDMAADGWPDADTGEMRHLDLALVDAGYARSSMDTPVYEFVRSSPGKIYRASKGFGTGGQGHYRHPAKRGHGRKLGNHWFATFQPSHKAWLYNMDSDYWKNFVHTGLLADPGRPGSLLLFGAIENAVEHRNYARQITAEIWTHEYKPGRGDVWLWKRIRRENHWFDTTYACCVAASICGMKTVAVPAAKQTADGKPAKRQPPAGKKRMRLSDLQRQKRMKG